VLQVVKNYTGDVLNFQIAGEIAADDGVEVASVLVDDDLATSGSKVGRRGTAAVLAVEKICGAAAGAGADLDTLAALGCRVVGSSRSLALALAAGAHPGDSAPPSSCRTTSSSWASASTASAGPAGSGTAPPTSSSTSWSSRSSPTWRSTAPTRSS